MDPTSPPHWARAALPADLDAYLGSLPIALYVRLSQNPDGTSESTATQIASGTRYAASAWPGRPVIVFEDDDITAADDLAYRPSYEAMLDALRRRQLGLVLTKNQSRISRHELIWPAFKVTCATAGISQLHTFAPAGVVEMAEGKSLTGDIINLINAEYAKQTKLNINDALAELARQGRPPGGKSFGLRHVVNSDGKKALVEHPVQGPAARTMASMLLAGDSLADCVRWCEAEGVPTVRGGGWSTTTVKSALLSYSIAGFRVYQGVPIGDGNWDPVIDRDTWYAMRAVLSQPRAVKKSTPWGEITVITNRPRRPARRYLLTGGFAYCGRCKRAKRNVELIAQQRAGRTAGSQPAYLCSSDKGGCNGISILADPLEAHVVDELFRWLEDPEFVALLRAPDIDADEREAIERAETAIEVRRVEAALAAAQGQLSVKALGAFETGLDAESAKLAERRANLSTPAPPLVDVELLQRASWEHQTLGEQRANLADLQCKVVVGPAKPGSKSFDAGRVSVSFMGKSPASMARTSPRRKRAATRSSA